jgi:hypothetical protein
VGVAAVVEVAKRTIRDEGFRFSQAKSIRISSATNWKGRITRYERIVAVSLTVSGRYKQMKGTGSNIRDQAFHFSANKRP